MSEIARMKNQLIIVLLFVLALNPALAQETPSDNPKPSTPSPDFPGSLVFEYGINSLINASYAMRTNLWQSATLNVYYMYPIKLGDSRFSFNPGIGVGSEKYGFKDPISFYEDSLKTFMDNIGNLPRFDTTTLGDITKTQLIANYVDIPLEFRVHSRKDDHERSWFLAVGGRIGVNFDAKTKIIYSENGSQKVYKDKFHYYINSFRYGAVARIGYGPLSVWGYYSGSKLFRGNKSANFANPSMWSFGLSLATF